MPGLPIATRNRQTKARELMRTPSLPVSGAILSPFFQIEASSREVGSGRNIHYSLNMIKAFILGYSSDGLTAAAAVLLEDTMGVSTGCFNIDLVLSTTSVAADFDSQVQAGINAYCTLNGVTLPSSFEWVAVTPTSLQTSLAKIAPATSYQTIVSQTGTAAPAVSGSLVPASTYPAGTTFTWARTGAGVYTLTASTAVFNTSGKTGVFIGGLNNLNGSWKAVVTSSTVITITTALQSLAVLGLLGFTATPTDALLTQTMVYVQTYP